MSSNTNIGNTPVNQGYVQLIHTGETGGIDGTLRTLYDGDGTASDLQIASNKVKISTQLYIGSKTITEYVQDVVGDMFDTNGSHTNITATYDDDGDGAIDLVATGAISSITGGTGIDATGSGDITIAIDSTVATKTYVDTEVAGLVDSAPGTLDTLNELAAALGDDPNFATTTATNIATKLAIASNLSDLASASTARTNLGVAIGSDVQAYNSTLASVAGGTYTGDDSITTLGTIGTGVWQGTAIASAYLDADTAHLSGTQTFSGAKTFSSTITGNLSGNVTGDVTGNADTATKWANPREISLTGDITGVTGASGLDGSADVSIATTIANNSVALGTQTTGNYMENVSAGTGISVSHTPSEGSTATISTNDSAIVHDNLSGFVANEHIDWTIDQGATNIHAGNYTDTNQLTTFVIQDGDTTNVTIDQGKYVKFQALTNGGLDIDWASSLGAGSSGDPYDLQFKIDLSNMGALVDTLESGDNLLVYNADEGTALAPVSEIQSALNIPSASGTTDGVVTLNANGTLTGESELTYSGGVLDISGSLYSIIRLNETDVTNNPAWWTVADGGNYSIRLNNTGTYPFQITTNASNNAVDSITLGYSTSILGNLTLNDSLTIGSGGNYAAGSIYSDSNWGMLFRAKQASPSLAEFRWANSADSELMRIDSSGNVIMQPTKKLYLDGGGNTYIDEPSGDQLRLVAGGTEVLKGYSSGVIDIYGGSINRSIELGANRTGDAASYIDFIGDTTYTDYGFRVIRNGGAAGITQLLHRGTGDLQLTTQEAGLIRFRTGGSDALIIDTSQNVGIGTTNPSSLDIAGNRLVVGGGSGDEGLTIFSGTTGRGTMLFADGNDGSNAEYRGWIQYEHTNDSLEFATASAEAMRINSSGNVGIGTAILDAGAKLNVVSGSSAYTAQFSRHDADDGLFLHSEAESTHYNWLISTQDNVDKGFEITPSTGVGNRTFSTPAFVIKADTGNVGIGTTSPGYKLDVAGDARITSGSLGVGVTPNATDGRGDFSNDVVAYSTSDKRLKENIKPLDNALDKVLKISGVEFDWKELTEEEKKTIHGNEGHDVGVIAQEIEEVLPEVVTTRDSGYKAVKYEKIVPLLIEAIKEQQKQIEELKNG